ncbi:hypothetical protein B0H16DRAFT_1730521 [Mycena metata]|uniref:Uncharacterized protein n=1 Tax=Mycena metata TaxID=1033252 RepID=A0AAD7MXC2_9AGAR|nr:hypothetical protein B0H16DRAFT_1730521 [Mycena metata]
MARTGPTAPSGHALRHLGHRVQLSRSRPSKSKATKASDDLRLASLRKSKSLLNAVINAEFVRREEVIVEIVGSSKRKPAYIRSLLSSARVHKTLKEMHKDLAEDERLGLFDMTCIDDKEKKRLFKQALENRKRTGIRGTTKAQQLDTTKTGLGVGNTLNDLFERTGARGLVMISRGKADDPTVPQMIDSDNASGFFLKAFGVSAVEVVQKFERYNISRDDGSDEKNGVREMRKQVGSTLLQGLALVTGKKQHKMEYTNYDVAIREAKGVELAGWPADIKFTDHANWSAESLRRLSTALHTGDIHWVKMTKTQHDELVAMHNAQREALGAGSLRTRKQRSDKGEARGPQKNKRQRKKGASRREESEDEDDDDESEEDDGDKDAAAAIEHARIGATGGLSAPPTLLLGVGTTSSLTAAARLIEQHAHIGTTGAITAPSTLVPGVGITSSLAAATPAPPTQSFNGSTGSLLPEHMPSLPTFDIPPDFDFEDPEFLEMISDPAAWMAAANGSFASPTDGGSMVFVAPPLSLANNSTSTPAPSSAGGGNSITPTPAGGSKRKRASENSDKSTRAKKAKGGENAPPAGDGGEAVKKPRKKRSDAGVPKGPRKSK